MLVWPAFLAVATLFVAPGIALGAELPRGPVTAQTVASAQAEATAAQTALHRHAAQAAALAGVALDQAKAASDGRRCCCCREPTTPENVAAAAAASAAQATAQQNFDAKTAAAATAAAEATADGDQRHARGRVLRPSLNRGLERPMARPGPPGPRPTRIRSPTYLAQPTTCRLRGPRHAASISDTPAGRSCPAYNPSKCPELLGAELPPLRGPRV